MQNHSHYYQYDQNNKQNDRYDFFATLSALKIYFAKIKTAGTGY